MTFVKGILAAADIEMRPAGNQQIALQQVIDQFKLILPEYKKLLIQIKMKRKLNVFSACNDRFGKL